MREHMYYEAFDGTTFSDKKECEEYEAKFDSREKAHSMLKSVLNFNLEPLYTPDDYCWSWYYLRNDEELKAVRNALFDHDAVADEAIDEPVHYPCWVVAQVSEYGWGVINTYDQVERNFLEYLKSLAVMMHEKMLRKENPE